MATYTNGSINKWNLISGGGVVGTVTSGGAKEYFVKDHLGSTRTVVNSSGTAVAYFDFYPYGKLMPGRYTTTNDDRYKFTGHELDEEAGLDLSYAGARYLDSEIGTWLSIDPLADKYPGWSPYNYTMGNPVNLVDPDGRMAKGCCVGVGAFNSLINSMTNLKALAGDKKAREVVKMRVGAQATLASAFVPGPEDLAVGAFLLSKTGQAVSRFGGRIGGVISGLFKKSDEVADLTRQSIDTKLDGYLLNKDHPDGGSKATWFDEALGFNKDNSSELADQIVFDPSKATEIGKTEYGTKYNQVISITGSNGRTIDVNFAWIKNEDEIVRLVTAIPTKNK